MSILPVDLRVEAHPSLREAGPGVMAAVDRLNLSSRRPTPYATSAYLEAVLANDEYAGAGSEPWLLGAWRGSELVGLLPLRRVRQRIFGLPSTKVEFLIKFDSDRPSAIARVEDEAAVSRAFYGFLLREAPGIQAVEFVAQEEASGLLPPPPDLLSGWYWRTLDGVPNATIPLAGLDGGAWFRGLSKKHRLNVTRRARKLLEAGEVEYLTSDDPAARLPLLDLYLELEGRGWKRDKGIGRHPARTSLCRALCAPGMPHALSFAFLLLDGLPVAAAIYGSFRSSLIEEETTYDDAFGALGPGNLLKVLTVGDAIEGGAPAMNLLGDFAYYKARWGAEVAPTRTLQLFRTWTPPWARARAGELRRRLFGAGASQIDADHNLVKRASEDGDGASPAGGTDSHAGQRAQTAETLARLRAGGVGLKVLSGAALRARLPFG